MNQNRYHPPPGGYGISDPPQKRRNPDPVFVFCFFLRWLLVDFTVKACCHSLQDQFANNDAEHEKQDDEGDAASAEPLLPLHAH